MNNEFNLQQKQKMEKKAAQTNETEHTERITRKDAIKKAGLTALTASSLLLLNTKAKASASATSNRRTGQGDTD